MPIKVNNLSYTYLKKTKLAYKALDDLSFTIKDKSFTCLIGETGSGKSTFIQHLNSLLKPDEGTIEILDYVLTKKKQKSYKELRKDIGLVFQFPESQLFEETVLKDVCFGLKNFGVTQEKAEKKAKDALTLLGIGPDKYERSPFELSGGERRRVALAGIFALEPKILILDEPTVGLDPKGSKEVLNIVKGLYKKGTTIILVTHDMDIVYQFASDVILLDHGHIVFNGTRTEFLNSKYVDDFSIPRVLKVVNSLNCRGFHIDIDNVYNINDLVEAIKGEIK